MRFAERFPILASVDPATWLMLPVAFLVTVSLVVGVAVSAVEVPQDCDPCHDPMMKRYDEYLCTGKVGPDGSFDSKLAACRKSLGKPAVY